MNDKLLAKKDVMNDKLLAKKVQARLTPVLALNEEVKTKIYAQMKALGWFPIHTTYDKVAEGLHFIKEFDFCKVSIELIRRGSVQKGVTTIKGEISYRGSLEFSGPIPPATDAKFQRMYDTCVKSYVKAYDILSKWTGSWKDQT